MPFDNPRPRPLTDIEILLDGRIRIDNPDCWLEGHFRKGHRHCLVAALGVAYNNPQFDARVEQSENDARYGTSAST